MSDVASAPQYGRFKRSLVERNAFSGWVLVSCGALIAIVTAFDLAIGSDYVSWWGGPSGLGMVVVGIATLLPVTSRRVRFTLMGIGFALSILGLVVVFR
ncbi:hypothetical protein [Rubrivirga sp.]|uniref:hypothetical protein n=1 Tax=Rubrivirga sp. TaxID=1885344 RepID=UPI003C745FFC